MKSTPIFLILTACALTGCVRVDVAGAISNFDRKSEALIDKLKSLTSVHLADALEQHLFAVE